MFSLARDFSVRQAKSGLSSRVKVSVTYLLIRRLAQRQSRSSERCWKHPVSKRASRSESEPIWPRYHKPIDDQPALSGEVCYLSGRNEHTHAQDDPGWCGTARTQGKAQEPGRADRTAG